MYNKGIFNDNQLTPVLGDNQIQRYALLASDGDIAAQNVLITHNLPFVLRVINENYRYSHIEYSELLSLAIMGLMKAARAFNYKKNENFQTFARTCIINEIKSYLKLKETRHSLTNRSLDALIEEGHSRGKNTYYDIVENSQVHAVEQEVLDKMEIQRIIKIIETFESPMQEVMILRFGLRNNPPMTQEEVAESLGIWQQQVSRIERKAILLIRETLLLEDSAELVFHHI